MHPASFQQRPIKAVILAISILKISFLALCLLPLSSRLCANEVQSESVTSQNADPDSPKPTPPAQADGVVWCALIHATPPKDPNPKIPEALKPLKVALESAQPKQKFELISQTSELVLKEYDTWVVLSDELYLRLDSGGILDPQSLNLYLQLWRDKKVLLKTEAVLRQGSPVIIQGPPYQGGRLLFAIQLEKIL